MTFNFIMECSTENKTCKANLDVTYCQCRKQLIRVQAIAERIYAPDCIRGHVIVETEKTSAQTAKDSVNRRVDYVLALLKTYKIQKKEIRLDQRLSRSDLDSNSFHFRVDVVFTVSLLDQYQEIVNRLTEKLVNYTSIGDPHFYHSDKQLTSHRLNVSLSAIDCAKEKANRIAHSLNLKLGQVISVTETIRESLGADEKMPVSDASPKRMRTLTAIDCVNRDSRQASPVDQMNLASISMKCQVNVSFRLL